MVLILFRGESPGDIVSENETTRCLEDGRLHQCWTVGCRSFEIRGPSRTSGPKLASKRSVQETPNAVSQPLGGLTKQQQKSVWDVPLLQSASLPPDRVSAEATEEVQRLEAALSALGERKRHAKPLVEALRVARAKAKVLPLEEQIVACKNFVKRARKRVTRVEAVISRALEQKVVFETVVQEGEARLQQLEESHSHRTVDAAASVTELQRRIDDLTRERDSLRAATPRVLPGVWMADGPPVVESIPPIPMSSVQDIEGWLSNRNCELRNALEFGDSATVARVGALVEQGSAQLASLVQGMLPVGDGQARSSLIAALIDQADAKRRCVEGWRLQRWGTKCEECAVRTSWCPGW